MVGIKPTLRKITLYVCYWRNPVLVVKRFPAVIPGLADGETRATKSLLVVRCAMSGSRRSRNREWAVRQGGTLSVKWELV